MKIKILQNEALGLLAKITKIPQKDLGRIIINRLIAEDMLEPEETDAANRSLWDIAEQNSYTTKQIKAVLFPDSKNQTEIDELLKAIYFWGTDIEHPCDECGCKMELDDYDWDDENQHEIDIYKCTNYECRNKSQRRSDDEEITYLSTM